MAATTRINRRISTATDINVTAAGIKLSVDDSNTGSTGVLIPQAGGNVACAVPASLILECTAATGSTISNKRMSFNGAMPTGFGFYMNTEGTGSNPTSSTYAQSTVAPAGVQAVIGAGALGVANYVWMGGGVANTTTAYDSTSAVISGAGMVGKWCKVVLALDNTATQTGIVAMPQIVITYDES
jgi:hypothetical protein